MSVASEITRLQNAKASLKSSINAKTDQQHQITDETLDEYADFVDSITSGGGDVDWTTLGFSNQPSSIQDGYDYAVYIKENYNIGSGTFRNDYRLIYLPTITLDTTLSSYGSFFSSCYGLLDVAPLNVQLSSLKSFGSMFSNCYSLRSVALFDTSKANNTGSMFQNCYNLKNVPQFDLSKSTNVSSMFYNCYILESVPQFDTSNVTNISWMFSSCSKLKTVPILNTSKVTNFKNMFYDCPELTDESLDNILQMCINASDYTGTKTLAQLGFTSTNYSSSRIQGLTHYQNFINAGWTIGY